MDIRAEILKEHSKQQAQKIAGYIGSNKDRFGVLMQLFLHDEYRVVQRAAWIVSIVAEQYPALTTPYLGKMVARMNEPGVPVAVKRNVVRILQHIEIPAALHAAVLNTCFNLLADPKETIAVRCFSMTVLDHLSVLYPDIRQELIAIIENQLEHEPSAGFKVRARRVLKRNVI